MDRIEFKKALTNFYEHCKIHPLYREALINREQPASYDRDWETSFALPCHKS